MEPSGTPSSGQSVEPWSQLDTLRHEKELLGYYVSGHPLDSYAGHFDSGKYQTIGEALKSTEQGTFKLAGLVSTVEKKFSRKDGKPFGIVVLEDFTGSIEITAWDESFAKNAQILLPGSAVSINARITRRDEAVRATAGAIAPLKPKSSVRPARIRIARDRIDESSLETIMDTVRKHPGKRPLVIEFVMPGGQCVELSAGDKFQVGDERTLAAALSQFAPDA